MDFYVLSNTGGAAYGHRICLFPDDSELFAQAAEYLDEWSRWGGCDKEIRRWDTWEGRTSTEDPDDTPRTKQAIDALIEMGLTRHDGIPPRRRAPVAIPEPDPSIVPHSVVYMQQENLTACYGAMVWTRSRNYPGLTDEQWRADRAAEEFFHGDCRKTLNDGVGDWECRECALSTSGPGSKLYPGNAVKFLKGQGFDVQPWVDCPFR